MNNSTALSPISSIVVTGGSGSLTVTCGSTSSLGTTITPTVSGTTYTYDLGGATYFNIAASSSAAITASSITFNFDSSNVAVTGVSLSSSTLTLTVGGSTSALTATISPSNATNQSVAWSSSNTDVASVVGGVVSPVASGNAIITVTTSDGSYTATCNVTVSTAATTLQSISVSGSTPDCTFGAASYAPSGLTVTAHYSDSSTADVTSGATFGSPDSKILGVQTPSVTYSTASSTYSVKVTNVGAVQGSGSTSTSSISFVPNAATTGASGSSYVTALTSFTTSSTTFGIANWNPSTLQVRGNQAVSATDTNFYLCNTTALPGPITKITLNAASSCLIGAKWSLAIGTASLGKTITGGTAGSGSSAATSVSISLTNADSNYFCLYVNASGATSGTALLSSTDSIVIEYTVSSGSQFFTDEEQASAWSTYFLAQTSGNCSNTVVWSNLEAEYEAMSSTAQAYFVAHEADTYASAYQRYASAISWYGLTAYIGSGSSALSTSPSNGTENSVIAIAAVAAVFALSLTGYIFFNRRRKHE